MSRRGIRALAITLATVVVGGGALALYFTSASPVRGASRAERLYLAHCAHCHGEDGRGSWRATLLLMRPGDFSDARQMRQASDEYLRDITRHGGSPLGRPGMPGFPNLSDEEIAELVRYLRTFPDRLR